MIVNNKTTMFTGQFSPSIFFKLSTYVIIPTLFIVYEISQIYKHQKPFPNCWISKCAQHYPQFVFFRIATISGSVLVILGWLTNQFYLKTICKQRSFKIQNYYTIIPTVLGIMGAMLLMGSTANIDTGKMNEDWHGFCASTFFIFTLVAQVYNTIISWLIYSKIKTLSYSNLIFKTVLIGLLVVQLLVSSYQGEEGWFQILTQGVTSDENTVAQFLQWSLTATIIAGYYAIGLDVDNFEFVYENVAQSQFKAMVEVD